MLHVLVSLPGLGVFEKARSEGDRVGRHGDVERFEERDSLIGKQVGDSLVGVLVLPDVEAGGRSMPDPGASHVVEDRDTEETGTTARQTGSRNVPSPPPTRPDVVSGDSDRYLGWRGFRG